MVGIGAIFFLHCSAQFSEVVNCKNRDLSQHHICSCSSVLVDHRGKDVRRRPATAASCALSRSLPRAFRGRASEAAFSTRNRRAAVHGKAVGFIKGC